MWRFSVILAALAILFAACSDTGAATPTSTTERLPTTVIDSTSTTGSTGGSTNASVPTTVAIYSTQPESVLPPLLAEVTKAWKTDWSMRTVDLDELRVGVVFSDPRDVIPPLDSPTFTRVSEAEFEAREPGMLVVVDGDARFYPLQILNLHEVVNDEIGGIPVAVTYCPLCNSAAVFDRRVNGVEVTFGTSGLLRNSDLVMWDRGTVSLWQQITGEAIVGELVGTSLKLLPSSIIRFADFVTEHPEGLVLSPDTGIYGAYGVNPYVGYSSGETPDPNFFSGEYDERLPALERVIGVKAGGEDRAFPFSLMAELQVVNDVVGGVPVVVFWGAADTADALDVGTVAAGRAIGTGVAFRREVDDQVLAFSLGEPGANTFRDSPTGSTWTLLGRAIDGPLAGTQLERLPHTNSFWFAWSAFHPDGTVATSAG